MLLGSSEAPSPASTEKQERSLEAWTEDVEQRLAALEIEIKEVEAEENTPSRSMTRQLKALTRLELLLTELAGERGKAEKLEQTRDKLQSEFDQLIQRGLSEEADTSFRRLDQVRRRIAVGAPTAGASFRERLLRRSGLGECPKGT